MLDSLSRPLRDLRISVTDRCNFRCVYCMPKDAYGRDFAFLPQQALLTYEEITRVARIAAELGVEKIRITGGEPLLRRDLPSLVSALVRVPGIRDLTLTTNGSLLAPVAGALRDAGLHRVTVSLDSLDDGVFRRMNDVDFPVARVLEGIDAALDAGFDPVKINVVVRRGMNEDSIPALAARFRSPATTVRFIEYMDVGTTNGWRLDEVVSGREILATLEKHWELEPLDSAYRGEVAQRYRYADGQGEIGIITSVSQPFCGDCTRLRMTAKGELYTCLFGTVGTDIRAALRGGAGDDTLRALLRGAWTSRADRYSELRSEATAPLQRVEMSHVGG